MAFLKLPVSPLPRVDFPTVLVSASLPGASPETVATSLTTPLERALGSIAGVTEITSSSTVGNARIVLQFDLSRSIDGAARDVQAAINAARMEMPSDLPSNPQYRKINPADAPTMVMALTSDTLGQGRLYDAASNVLQQKLSQVTGVGQVALGGSSLPAVRRRDQPVGADEVRASDWKACGPRWRRPTPTRPRARSRSATGATRSIPTTRRGPPPNTAP